MKLIDLCDGLRPYKGGLYQFLIKYTSGEEKCTTGHKKQEYKGYVNEDVEQIVIDLKL